MMMISMLHPHVRKDFGCYMAKMLDMFASPE